MDSELSAFGHPLSASFPYNTRPFGGPDLEFAREQDSGGSEAGH
jgi:hypothetical protein